MRGAQKMPWFASACLHWSATFMWTHRAPTPTHGDEKLSSFSLEPKSEQWVHVEANGQRTTTCTSCKIQKIEVNDFFFLICRRARRQRSQSPILVTVRIDKHFKLYIDWSLSGKSKSSQLASQVMESTSTFFLMAQSAIRRASTVQSSYSKIEKIEVNDMSFTTFSHKERDEPPQLKKRNHNLNREPNKNVHKRLPKKRHSHPKTTQPPKTCPCWTQT